MTGHAPVYLQIRAALTAAIIEGRHNDGDPLPSVRALASRHHANPLTVAKAYQVLQEEGVRSKLVEQGALPGSGTPESFAKFVQAEYARNQKIVQTANIKE